MKLIKCVCGKEPDIIHVKQLGVPHYHKFKVGCLCGLENTYIYDTKEEAIGAWNEIFKEHNFHRSVPAGNARLGR
jgi:hypothetical protein